MKRSLSAWRRCHLDGVADLLKAANEARAGFVGVGAIEIGGAEFAPFGPVAQHVPSRGEHRGGHADDGLLGAPSRAQAVKLGLQVSYP